MVRHLRAGQDPAGHRRAAQRGVDVELLDDAPFLTYVSACAITLARAHGQSPNIAAVVGYIGKNDEVARAVTDWSLAYADVSEQDYRDFLNAG